MEHESLEFKIVIDDGPNTEVLARLAHLDIAGPAYRAAVLKYPQRNVQLRHGARIIERHDGAPPPPPLVERDPNLKSWSAHLIGGKKVQLLGVILALRSAAPDAFPPHGTATLLSSRHTSILPFLRRATACSSSAT